MVHCQNGLSKVTNVAKDKLELVKFSTRSFKPQREKEKELTLHVQVSMYVRVRVNEHILVFILIEIKGSNVLTNYASNASVASSSNSLI